jgi:mycothiol synthase
MPEIKLRPYQPSDLPKVLSFVGKCLEQSNLCGYHPGDMVHWMSNEQRGENLHHTFWLHEKNNNLVALANLPFEKWNEFALIMHPARITHSDSQESLELDLLKACEDIITSRFTKEQPLLSINVAVTDQERIHCLEKLGYQGKESDTVVDSCSLEIPIPVVGLPDGFYIRSVAGEHEAALLADVHNSAFGSSWTVEEYLKVMRTPGFDSERELVVVTPAGRLAAFLVYWLDPISKSGLFEPVGCHKDFQRMGLSKALMFEAMRRMMGAGMQTAMVGHSATNMAAVKLYASVGFREHFRTLEYSKNF